MLGFKIEWKSELWLSTMLSLGSGKPGTGCASGPEFLRKAELTGRLERFLLYAKS